MHFLYILLVLLGPYLIMQFCKQFPWFSKIGLVVLSYLFGLCLSLVFDNDGIVFDCKDALSSLLIPLAIPLLLLQTQWTQVKKLAKVSFLSLFSGIVATITTVSIGYMLFGYNLNDASKIGGLLVGAYTGGTPNLASLKLLLDVDETTYLATHSADMVFSTIYLFFFLSIGQKVTDLVLKKSKGRNKTNNEAEQYLDETTQLLRIFEKGNRHFMLRMFAFAVVILGSAFVFSMLFPAGAQTPIVILGITTLGIGGSFVSWINKKSVFAYETGMYLILSFSIVVASMIQFETFQQVQPALFAYVAFTIFVGLFIHLFLAKLCKIDTDTFIATSTSLICSPPFVPVVAGALKNRTIIVPGITVGIIGYAIANYLGYIMSFLLSEYL